MKYASVCSGVEAASLAWMPLGWEAAWFSEIEPFPCEVLKQRFPGVPNLGDMTKIKVENLENGDQRFTNGNGTTVIVPGGVDLLVGGTPCFPAETMVLTPGGYKPIGTLQIGDEVVSHLGNVCKVSATGSKIAPIGKLKIVGRPKIACTANHPFLTIDVKRDCCRKSKTYSQIISVGEWGFSAAEKSVGKYAGRLNVLQSDYHLPETELADTYLLELAGWYVGDGYIRKFKGKNKKAIILALVSEEKIRIFKQHFDGKINFCIGSDGKITIYNTRIAEFLIDNFGEKADGKKVPYWLYSSEKLKSAFLFGLETTDGCDKGDRIYITTISESLAYGVADLYRNASVRQQKVQPKKEIQGRTINQHDYYVISAYKKHTPKTKFINGRYASRVKEFENGSGTVGTVFNITVSGDHTYIVNGIAVHNCQSFSVAGKREGLDGASGLAKTFVELLYAIRPRWFVWENVPGCLSSRDKQTGIYDFNFLLSAFTGGGYSCSWRILDGQYVRVDGFPRAVPQRRRRVFVVGHLGDEWEYPAEVLFEQAGLFGNSPPCRIKGKGFTADVERSIGTASGFRGIDLYNQQFTNDISMPITAAESDPHHIPSVMESTFWNGEDVSTTLTEAFADDRMPDKGKLPCVITPNGEDISDTLDASYYKGVGNRNSKERTVVCLNDQGGSVMQIERDGNAGTLRANTHGNEQIVCVHGAETPISNTEHANPVTCNHNGLENVVCWAAGGFGQKVESDVSATISTDHDDRVTGNNAALIQERICYYPSQHQVPKESETPTLTTDNCSGVRGDTPLVHEYYHWHSPALTVKKIEDECSPTIPAAMGMGGANMTTPALIQECYAIDSVASNSMKSGNPHSGFHKVDIAKTLDTADPNPIKNQGGNIIVESTFFEPGIAKREGGDSRFVEECSGTLRSNAGDNQAAVAIAENIIGRKVENGGNGTGAQEELAYTQNASGVMGVANHATVRRLLPIETERLMGFPDNHTRIPWKGKPAEECPDSPRYKACGNSMCVNVMRWIGMRIELTERKANSIKNKDKKK